MSTVNRAIFKKKSRTTITVTQYVKHCFNIFNNYIMLNFPQLSLWFKLASENKDANKQGQHDPCIIFC